MNFMPLFLTFISGLFFLIGIFIYKIVENKTKFANISIACAMIVLTGLIAGDLLPELLENSKWYYIFFVLLGFGGLILIDKLVPHHEHHHEENDEKMPDHVNHLNHISIITLLALLLHNLIEGIGLYSVAQSDIKSGLLMLFGIGMHNLPFGFQIANLSKNKKNIVLIVLLILSGFIGGLISSMFGTISHLFTNIITSITMGMLLHILIFELLKEVWQNKKEKDTICGIIIGIIILVIINLM